MITVEYVHPIRDTKQIETIRDLLAYQNKRNALLFVMGIGTGLRISDILAMKVGDVIDERGRIKKEYYFREKKTRKYKKVTFSKYVIPAIEDYLRGYKGSMNRPLFVSQKRGKNGEEQPILREQAWKILTSAAKRVGITENIGTHTLRKTFGYHAYRNKNVSIEYLQLLFNHRDPSITLRYIGILQEELDDIYEKMDFK